VPKIKTHKSTAKRFRYTGGGKLVRMKQGLGHLRRKKPRRVKAQSHKVLTVESSGARRRIRRLTPYASK